MNPRQGDLFLYGTESLICPINRKGSWVGCLGWQRGWARTFFLSNFFPFQPFSFISDKNRLMKVPNSYFFLNIFKNRLKWIKNPNLHDSPWRVGSNLQCMKETIEVELNWISLLPVNTVGNVVCVFMALQWHIFDNKWIDVTT